MVIDPAWNYSRWKAPASESSPWGNETFTPPRMSVSGLSAGGSMAVQHLVAFSGTVDGATIAGGSPYGCGGLGRPFVRCYYGNVNVQASVEYVYWRRKQGNIDDPSGLAHIPVVLFSGKNDWVVYTAVMRETKQQLESFVDTAKLAGYFYTQAGHVWSIDHGDCKCGDCSGGGSTLCCDINDCSFDLSGTALRQAYGGLNARATAQAQLRWIEQHAYLPPASRPDVRVRRMPTAAVRAGGTLMKYAIAYVPPRCEADVRRCKLHVNYHGCDDLNWKNRLRWVKHLDLLEYAQSNDLVVLFPQARGDNAVGVGCWNWVSYEDDPYFDTQWGVQLGTVVRMAADLRSALLSNSTYTSSKDEVPPEVQAKQDELDAWLAQALVEE